jgi:release factor glutamine methyltransferase
MTRTGSTTLAEVYPAREDSRLLARFARPRRGDLVLEIGCGRGLASLAAARHGARLVVATDLNPAALRAVYRRARAEELPLEVLRTDLAAGLRRFDLILSNPPYLPTAGSERDTDPWVDLALDGGPDGCRVTARLLRTLPGHLAEGGRAYVLVSSLQSRARLGDLRRRWIREGGACRTCARERWGKETLSIWCLSRGSRRSVRSTRGKRARRRVPPGGRSGSSRDAGPGRTTARGGA